jgi:hypothetical protein
VRHCRLLGAVVFCSIVREERGCRCGACVSAILSFTSG